MAYQIDEHLDPAPRRRSAGMKNPHEVSFTPRQMAWLRQRFQQIVMQPDASPAEMHHYFGQQSVLACIEGRVCD